jgi:hypothetical protein
MALTVVVLLATTALACWGAEGEDLTVKNSSSEVVVVFEDDAPIALLHPRVSEGFHILPFTGTKKFSVQTFESRVLVAERTFSWDEISKEDGITITVE